jgi:hypothetical protein
VRELASSESAMLRYRATQRVMRTRTVPPSTPLEPSGAGFHSQRCWGGRAACVYACALRWVRVGWVTVCDVGRYVSAGAIFGEADLKETNLSGCVTSSPECLTFHSSSFTDNPCGP